MRYEYLRKAVNLQHQTDEARRYFTGEVIIDLEILMTIDLNALGRDGWELVSSVRIDHKGMPWQVILFFKRELV